MCTRVGSIWIFNVTSWLVVSYLKSVQCQCIVIVVMYYGSTCWSSHSQSRHRVSLYRVGWVPGSSAYLSLSLPGRCEERDVNNCQQTGRLRLGPATHRILSLSSDTYWDNKQTPDTLDISSSTRDQQFNSSVWRSLQCPVLSVRVMCWSELCTYTLHILHSTHTMYVNESLIRGCGKNHACNESHSCSVFCSSTTMTVFAQTQKHVLQNYDDTFFTSWLCAAWSYNIGESIASFERRVFFLLMKRINTNMNLNSLLENW